MFRVRVARHIARTLVMVGAILAHSASWAQNPSLEISQHGHRAWRSIGGLALGTISAIAQTTDGYLWLATPSGLLRFDGVRGLPVRPPTGADFDEGVRALLGSRDGALWIGTSRGLHVYSGGSFQPLKSLSSMTVNAIQEGSDGTIWAAGIMRGKGVLCAIRKIGDECLGEDGRLGPEVVALHRDSASALWVVGMGRVWKWGTDPMVSFALPVRADALRSVAEMEDGSMAIGMRGRVERIADGRIETLPLPGWALNLAFDKALRTRDGSLWFGTSDAGLVRLHEGRLDTFAQQDGLSANKVLDLFEDVEGNIWVSTLHGLDQFRPIAAANQSGRHGLKGRARGVLNARDGSMWVSTTTGVYQSEAFGRWKLRRPPLTGVASLFEDRRGRIWAPSDQGVQYFDGNRFVDPNAIPTGPIDALTEDANGDLWLAHRELGLVRVQSDGKSKFVATIVLRPSSRVSTLTIDPVNGSLWIGLWSGGLEQMRDGRLVGGTTFLVGPDASARINHLRAESDGTLWASTSNGMYRVDRGQVARLNMARVPSCNQIFWSFANEAALWLSGQCGLMRIDRADVDAWTQAEDKGIRMTVAAALLDTQNSGAQVNSGGTIGYITLEYNFSPKIAPSADGKLWFVTGDSLVSVEPGRIPANVLPPRVHVERLTSDGKSFESRVGLRLPPIQHNIEIDYTALNVASPERVRFRYRLDGRDTDWQDAGTRRQAFYTDLAPGQYQFHVSAANEGGEWNAAGGSFEFSILPAWWQTLAFRVGCLAAVALALYALYKMRIDQLARRFNITFKARVSERFRIARELHDTLLQSLQGLVLLLQAAQRQWPSDDGRRILENAIDRGVGALTEGRDAVQGLRSTEPGELVDAIRALGQVLAADPESPPFTFDLDVQGWSRSLDPTVRDEVFRIVGEAMRNASRHAQPKKVEVEIRYDEREFRISVRDDGSGIDRRVAKRGRQGHFGLRGMRERAKLIGGKLTLSSAAGEGTTVILKIPGVWAYGAVEDDSSLNLQHATADKGEDIGGQGEGSSHRARFNPHPD